MVYDRLVQVDLASADTQDQIALSIDSEFLCTLEEQLDGLGVGGRCDDEVMLQLALAAVINQIHAWIDGVVFHFGVVRDISAPLRRIVADEVVALSGQLLQALHSGFTVCS